MKFNEIFDTKENEVFDSVKGMRYSLVLDDACRIYKFDKKVGVRLSVYVDHLDCIDEEFSNFDIIGKQHVTLAEREILGVQIDSINLWALVQVECFNNDTQTYNALKPKLFQIRRKERKCLELLLDPAHLNDDGEVKIRVQYSFFFYNIHSYGFLRRKSEMMKHYIVNSPYITLSNVISEERADSTPKRETRGWFDDYDY